MNWNLDSHGVNSQLELFSDLSQDELLIAELLKTRGRLPVDRISNELNLGLTATSSLLLELEFKGVVRSLPGKIYELISSLTIRV
jgi:DNA processing protein